MATARKTAVALLAAASAWSPAPAQPFPAGPEFQINEFTSATQWWPDVAAGRDGGFVIVWLGQDALPYGILGRRLGASGSPLGPESVVNTYTTGDQWDPAVAADGSGNFIVVWQSTGQDGDAEGVFLRRFDSLGDPLDAADVAVNEATTGSQRRAAVAASSAGDFVVVWESAADDPLYDVVGRRFDSAGAPLGPGFKVNTYTTNQQRAPRVAMDGAGNFIVVWQSNLTGAIGYNVQGRIYDSAGSALGDEFQVNSFSSFFQKYPSAAARPDGAFVVVWGSNLQEVFDVDYGYGIFGRVVDGGGSPTGADFQVNAYSFDDQILPEVAPDGSGGFVVAWSSEYQDGDRRGVFGRALGGSGAPAGDEFQINTYTTETQWRPRVAVNPDGDFLVVWHSFGQDGSHQGVFGRRFLGPISCDLGDPDADGVCDNLDNCVGRSNPGQGDADADGLGDLCDVVLTSPMDMDALSCADPRNARPTVSWDPGDYDRFRVLMGPDPGFTRGTWVSSGTDWLRQTAWTPSGKKWRRACGKAIGANPSSPVMFFIVRAVDRDRSRTDSLRTAASQVVQAGIQP